MRTWPLHQTKEDFNLRFNYKYIHTNVASKKVNIFIPWYSNINLIDDETNRKCESILYVWDYLRLSLIESVSHVCSHFRSCPKFARQILQSPMWYSLPLCFTHQELPIAVPPAPIDKPKEREAKILKHWFILNFYSGTRSRGSETEIWLKYLTVKMTLIIQLIDLRVFIQ